MRLLSATLVAACLAAHASAARVLLQSGAADCAVSSAGPLLARLSRCAPRASSAQHHALDTLLDASPPNPGTDVNEPEAAVDLAEGADTAAAHPRTVRYASPGKARPRRLLGEDDADDDDDEDEYEECEDGEQGCEDAEIED